MPKAASEVDFDITNPPLSSVIPPLDHPVLESPSEMNCNDVLCGSGRIWSQEGNRRYRALIQDFQLTSCKDKKRMARSIVLLVRKRGGRFLIKRDRNDGRLYEIGDKKAEAKTSLALYRANARWAKSTAVPPAPFVIPM
ncbi:hypothetical protein ACHAXN_008905 [Cyclotella atomus]